MNIFINTIYLNDIKDGNLVKRFPMIYFWLKDYYFQQSNENFSKTSWSFCDELTPISENFVLQQKFKENPPNIVGLSLYMWNEEVLLKNAQWIKENYPEAVIVAAGPSAEASVDFLQEHSYIDFVIVGPGAEVFKRILDAKIDNTDCCKVDGIAYLHNNKLTINKPVARHLDPLILNYITNFPDEVAALIEQYLARYKKLIVSTILIQGCPYSCSFCEQGTALWTKINKRPLKNVFAEIDFVTKYKNIILEFVDANFGIVPEYEKILDYIIEKNDKNQIAIKRPTMAKNNFDVTFDLIDKMVKNKLLANHNYYIALQDTNVDVLNLNGRPPSKEFEKIEKFKAVTKNQTYKVNQVDIIIGMPGQSFDTLSNTLFDLLDNDLLGNSLPMIYSIFPNTTLTSTDNKIYYKANTVYFRKKDNAYIESFADTKNNLKLKYIVETDSINSAELVAAYYMFVMLGHTYGFLGWLRTPLSYLKNYHNVDAKQFVDLYTSAFAPKNWHLLPEEIQQDLNSLLRWFTGEDKYLQRKDNTNSYYLTTMKISVYRFHASYTIVSKFFESIFKKLIGKNDLHLDTLMTWQKAKTLKFDGSNNCKLVSYNYDDIAAADQQVFYKSEFEFIFEIDDASQLYSRMLELKDLNFIPNIIHRPDSPDTLHINDIKNNHFNSI